MTMDVDEQHKNIENKKFTQKLNYFFACLCLTENTFDQSIAELSNLKTAVRALVNAE